MTGSVSEGVTSLGIVSVLGIICSAAVCSNIIVLLVVILNKAFRTVTDLFICNLAVSDVILAGVGIPLMLNQAVVGDQKDYYPGGEAGCKMVMFIPKLSIIVSIVTMVAISFERYFTISKQKTMTAKQGWLVITIVWMLALAFASPQLYEYSVYENFEEEENETEMSCGSHGIPENFETIYASILVFVCYVVPLIIITVNYSLIAKTLHQITRNMRNGNGDQTGLVSKNKVKVIKMMATLTFVFAILWAPYFVLFTMEEVTGTDDSSEADSLLHSAKQTMIALSTVSNPILYMIFNQRFRSATICLISCKKSGTTSSQVATSHKPQPVTQQTNSGTNKQ